MTACCTFTQIAMFHDSVMGALCRHTDKVLVVLAILKAESPVAGATDVPFAVLMLVAGSQRSTVFCSLQARMFVRPSIFATCSQHSPACAACLCASDGVASPSWTCGAWHSLTQSWDSKCAQHP